MDPATIADWLKTSILGVIVLGAIGSIFALLLLRLGKYLLRLTGLGINRWTKREFNHGWRTGVIAGYLSMEKDATHAVFFMAYCLARVVVASLITIIIFIVFYALLPSTGPILQATTFLAATAFCLAGRWVYEETRNISEIYKHMIQPIFLSALEIKEAEEKES